MHFEFKDCYTLDVEGKWFHTLFRSLCRVLLFLFEAIQHIVGYTLYDRILKLLPISVLIMLNVDANIAVTTR